MERKSDLEGGAVIEFLVGGYAQISCFGTLETL
jgi:hypothetical protein